MKASSIESVYRLRGRRLVWYRVLSVLMCITIFITTYILMLPATTLEADEAAVCGFISHKHDAACMNADGELVCGLPEHEHDMGCYKTAAVASPYACGFDYEHTHDEGCYSGGVLICSQTEHVHTEECLGTAEQFKERILTGKDLILTNESKADAIAQINELLGALNESYYVNSELSKTEYQTLSTDVSGMFRELGGITPLGIVLRAPGQGTPLLGTASDPVNFAKIYDTAANRANDWQIVSGREGDGSGATDGEYQIIWGDDGKPVMRIKKSVLPAGEEDRFYICLNVEPIYTWNWHKVFSQANIMVSNSKNYLEVDNTFSRSESIQIAARTIGISEGVSYFEPRGTTFTNANTTNNNKSQIKQVNTIRIERTPGQYTDYPVSLDCCLSSLSNPTFIYSVDGKSYKSKQCSYSGTTITVPNLTYTDMVDHGFEIMDAFSTVSFESGSGVGTMTGSTEIKTVTDYLPDNIRLLELVSYSGNAQYVEADHALEWSLAGTEPYLYNNGNATADHPYNDAYELVLDLTATEGANAQYSARKYAYQMIYKVELANDAEGFVSSVNNSALPAAENTAAAAKYNTNDRGSDRTTLAYELVGSDDEIFSCEFDTPVVRGALYGASLRKEDANTHAPLADAVFELTALPSGAPVFVTGSAGSYTYAPNGSSNVVITGQDGIIHVSDLPDGEYKLEEIEPPAGYDMTGTDSASFNLCYTTNASALTASGDVFTSTSVPTVVNTEKKNYTLTLHKQDGDTSEPIEDTVFTVYCGAAKICDLTTDENGNASLPTSVKLYAGETYTLRETTSAPGYIPPTDGLTFTLSQSDVMTANTADTVSFLSYIYNSTTDTYSVTVANFSGVVLPSTGGIGAEPVALAGIVTMVIAVLGICYYKKKSHEIA